MGGMAKQACKDYLNARATMRIELKNQPPDSQGDPMTLKKKLFACLAALAMATTFVSVLSLWQMNHGRVALQSILKDQVEPMSDLKIVGDKYAVDIVDASHKAHAGTISFAEAAQTVSAGAKAIDANWRRYKDTKIEGEEALLAEEAEAEMRVADANVAELEQILRRGDREALDSFVENKLYQSIDPVSGTVGDLVTLQIANAEKTAAGASATALLSRNVTIGLVALALLVFVISLSIVSSKVIAPVRALADTIRGLAAQKGSAQVPHLDQQDEIGDIARSVETFRQAVVHAEQEKALAASHATETLGEGLSALASGDLTYQLEGDFPEAYEKLKTDFNETAAEQRKTLADRAQYRSDNVYTDFAKLYLDGVPPALTASLLEPYEAQALEAKGQPADYKGALRMTPDAITQDAIELAGQGVTVKMHATGDGSVRAALNAFEAAREANPDGDLHHSIAHASVVAPADIPRFAELDVAADVAPPLWIRGPYSGAMRNAIGDRYDETPPTRDLLDAGALISYGSDWPSISSSINPWPHLASMVEREIGPQESISLQAALDAMTRGAAYTLNLSDEMGSIEVGKSADLVVIDRDIFDIPLAEVADTKALVTVFRGQTVYEAELP